MEKLLKTYYSHLLTLLIILQSCNKPDCKNYPHDIGSINLTLHDKSVFFTAYPLNQTVMYLRNNKDTFTFHTSNSYFNEDQFSYSGEVEGCGSLNKCELENHGIYIYTPFKDSSFYLFTQTIYNKNGSKFTDIKPEDSLSFLSFGLAVKGFDRVSAVGAIDLTADNFYTDSLLLNNIPINGKIFNKVFHYKNPNSYWRIKEIYFHPVYGAIKFSFYKIGSLTLDGDQYEIIL